MNYSSEKVSSQSLQVWYCEHCEQVHFKTQNVMLDFSKQEFANLTNAMLNIYQNHFNPLEIKQIAKNFNSGFH